MVSSMTLTLLEILKWMIGKRKEDVGPRPSFREWHDVCGRKLDNAMYSWYGKDLL